MRVLVIRHAIAEDRVEFARTGKSDDERPLTSEGECRMRQAARGLRTLVPTIDLMASSPLTRARQTAEIVRDAYRELPVEIVPALSGDGDLDGVVAWLAEHMDLDTTAVVGHEPDLSSLISYLLTGSGAAAVTMKKGAVCQLEFADAVEPGRAVLRWLLAPKHLRSLGRDDA
ncbi:MAG: phosphohistidine phosphatase SixA [Gemmatimonadales bacterium]|jgi:phosphohistidine phosphatase